MNWKAIKGYEGLYEVSDSGLIRNSSTYNYIKSYAKNGYLAINLYSNHTCKHYYIHRLVAETFIENPNRYKYVNHIDCDKHNNSVYNLEWCTQKQNIEHSIINGLQHRRYKTIVDSVEYGSMMEASLKAFSKNYNCVSLLYSKLGNEFIYLNKKVVVIND